MRTTSCFDVMCEKVNPTPLVCERATFTTLNPPFDGDLEKLKISSSRACFRLTPRTPRPLRIGKGGTTDATKAASELDSTATELVLMQVASFLKHELPIRLAHRIKDLDDVPMMSEMKSVLQVRDWYEKSMTELIEFPAITSKEEEEKFAKLLEGIYERHAGVLVTMARGAFELR